MIHKPVILFQEGLLDDVGIHIKKFSNANKAVIVSDENVSALYSKKLAESLKRKKITPLLFSFKEGERSKNFLTVTKIYKFMVKNYVNRNDVVIALGGGVVGDIAGFVASTYMRGVDFVQIPTTLLAQVDSSIGGKNGVNFSLENDRVATAGFKNLVGTFHMPKAILIDPLVLKTLPKSVFVQGIAEVIKYAAIGDKSLFNNLLNFGFDESMILMCAKKKESIIEKDFFDEKNRVILNFGHTFAHAIEKVSNYKIPHGFAVSIGMCEITKFSQEKNLTEKGTYESLVELVKKFSLAWNCDISFRQIYNEICLDKKVVGNKIKLVILKKIGKAEIISLKLEDLLK